MVDENKGEPPTQDDAEPKEPEATDAPEAAAKADEPVADATTSDDAEEAATDEAPAKDDGKKSASPAAILARVQGLGEESESDRVAREEEEKLAERRASKKRSRLESAASKKLDKIGTKPKKKKQRAAVEDDEERAVARPQGDALYQRTMTLGEWISKNAKQVAVLAGAAAVIGAGVFGYFAYQSSRNTSASKILVEANAAQNGRIGAAAKQDDGPADLRPEFASAEARDDAALSKYRQVAADYKGTGPAILARLAEGSLLLDKKDADGARAAFVEVKDSALAQVDTEIRGRALEGLGFAYELQGNLDEAAKTYRDLENNVDVRGFKELALYHQARVAEAKGDKDKAVELYKTAFSRVSDEMNKAPFPYLREAVEDRLRGLDPSALPPKTSPFNLGGGPSKMSEAQLRKLQEQIQKQMEEAQKKQQEQQNPGQSPP